MGFFVTKFRFRSSGPGLRREEGERTYRNVPRTAGAGGGGRHILPPGRAGVWPGVHYISSIAAAADYGQRLGPADGIPHNDWGPPGTDGEVRPGHIVEHVPPSPRPVAGSRLPAADPLLVIPVVSAWLMHDGQPWGHAGAAGMVGKQNNIMSMARAPSPPPYMFSCEAAKEIFIQPPYSELWYDGHSGNNSVPFRTS